MTSFVSEKTIIRRFLRDPNGNIWSDNDILTYWNDSQLEIATKIGFIESVNTYKYPPEWTFSYMRDWEYQYLEGDRYKCLLLWQARDCTICYPWESAYWLDGSNTPDSGYRFILPWEGVICASPADIVPVPLHERFNSMKFLSYDEQELRPIDRKGLASADPFYRTATGTAQHYWRQDIEGNTIVPYPRPSNVTYDDIDLLHSPLDSFDDAGGIITWTEAEIPDGETGIVTSTLDADDKFFAVFEAIPRDVSEDSSDWSNDSIDVPEYFIKYVRYATLERCLGADTDGFVPSLRDFWQLRKELGIKAIKRFKAMRKQDRDYRLGGGSSRAQSRHPRLPSAYPSQEL